MTKKQERIKKMLQEYHGRDFVFEPVGDKAYYFRDKRFPNFWFYGHVPQRKIINVAKRYLEVLIFCINKRHVKICRDCKHCFKFYLFKEQSYCKKGNLINTDVHLACDMYEVDK